MKLVLLGLGVFLQLTLGCAEKISVVEDDEGNRVTTTYRPGNRSWSGLRESKTKIDVPTLNLSLQKIKKLTTQLPQMKKSGVNDVEGFNVYVKELNSGQSICFASIKPDNIENVKSLLSRGTGIVEPAYILKNPEGQFTHAETTKMIASKAYVEDGTAVLDKIEKRNKRSAQKKTVLKTAKALISGLRNLGLSLYGEEDTLKYERVLADRERRIINEKISQYTEPSADIAKNMKRITEYFHKYSFYDKELLDTIAEQIGTVDYIVMPNSEVHKDFISDALLFHSLYRMHSAYQGAGSPHDGKITNGVVFVSADAIRNIESQQVTFGAGLYGESLLTVGCTDGRAESVVAMMKYLKTELKLSGSQKSKTIGE